MFDLYARVSPSPFYLNCDSFDYGISLMGYF